MLALLLKPLASVGMSNPNIFSLENRAVTADVTAQTRKPRSGKSLASKLNEANKTAIFVQCLPKTIQGWRRPGYICSVPTFLQLYLFDFKMPEFEFIDSFFPCSFILQIYMLTSINPWFLPFLVVVQLHYSSCIFKKICTSATV